LQSERGCKEATARETKSDSKRDKEEDEEETGDYIFACKTYLFHYQFLELLEVLRVCSCLVSVLAPPAFLGFF
jgi:hypothetical protein